jgi:hypothetical protein
VFPWAILAAPARRRGCKAHATPHPPAKEKQPFLLENRVTTGQGPAVPGPAAAGISRHEIRRTPLRKRGDADARDRLGRPIRKM